MVIYKENVNLKNHKIGVDVDGKTHLDLLSVCRKENRTKAALIRHALVEYIRRSKNESNS